MHRSSIAGLFIALITATAIAGCSSESEPTDQNATTGDEQDLTSASLSITCSTLGTFNACGNVTFCQARTEASCRAKASAIASNPDWERMCPRAGVNEMACGWQSSFCNWEATTQCLPKPGFPAPPGGEGGDPIDVTCRTLGELGQCGAVSICKEKVEGMCKAKASAVASDPEWERMCPRAGVNQQACGWQSNFCNWEQVSQCVRR